MLSRLHLAKLHVQFIGCLGLIVNACVSCVVGSTAGLAQRRVYCASQTKESGGCPEASQKGCQFTGKLERLAFPALGPGAYRNFRFGGKRGWSPDRGLLVLDAFRPSPISKVLVVQLARKKHIRHHKNLRLPEQDVDAGVLENHLQFIQRRRLCLMRWIANDGGVLELLPRPGQSAFKAMTIPIVENRLLVFRSDLFSFSYKPLGRGSLALMTWILDTGSQAARQTAKGFFGVDDALQHSEALGIFVGPPMPTGYRMHIMAMHTHTPGGSHDLDGFECMLTSGVDGFIHIPATRFDTEVYCCPEGEKFPGQSYVRHAAMMSDQDRGTQLS